MILRIKTTKRNIFSRLPCIYGFDSKIIVCDSVGSTYAMLGKLESQSVPDETLLVKNQIYCSILKIYQTRPEIRHI